MATIISYLKNCRICKNENLVNVIELGEQVITSRFPDYGDFSTPKTPITLCMCQECGLIQLVETTDSSELYELHEYGYRSGISNTMRQHLLEYQTEILTKVSLESGDVIVDIGSNDSTMLQYYSSDFTRIGVDPTGNQFHEYYGNVQLLPTYFTYDNFYNQYGNIKCKIVSSISMFYDLPDPVQFAKDIYNILDDDGVWTCEQSYLLTMLKTNSIDTICHEHLEYYALKQVKLIADMAGFKIIDIKFNNCNGGSFRVYFNKKTSNAHDECTELINRILQEELDFGIMDATTYKNFIQGCDAEVKKLFDFIDYVNENEKVIYIYGASTKGNCLLQYANITSQMIRYAVERNPKKIGKMTSTGTEIIGEETMRENPPDYLLVLPWHFKTEILERESTFLQNGGQFIFPFPHFEIIGSKQKLLITGCDGLIGSYLKTECASSYNLYGIVKTKKEVVEKNIIKFYFDNTIQQPKHLEYILNIIRPDIIVHLSSISSSQQAFKYPLETVEANGVAVARLCDIIYRNNWNTRLFNASSSEIYKGHVQYHVLDVNDHNMFHSHPYSIGKILGHSIVDFYRDTHKMPFSNGTIFTTTSYLKRDEFLLNKIANHAKKWRNGEKDALTVGSLSSRRNLLHAVDVAKAIGIIINQPKGDNYVICGDESYLMSSVVKQLYGVAGIETLEFSDNLGNSGLVEQGSIFPVLIIDKTPDGVDTVPINITGETTKLKELGWMQTVSLDDMLRELIEK